jgi:hypothetical protein
MKLIKNTVINKERKIPNNIFRLVPADMKQYLYLTLSKSITSNSSQRKIPPQTLNHKNGNTQNKNIIKKSFGCGEDSTSNKPIMTSIVPKREQKLPHNIFRFGLMDIK